ncbi:MAG: c-type cytochrome [Nitrospirota bacterium]|nr:MAG: c-type cytochrome [Nitrospirota bacterium]
MAEVDGVKEADNKIPKGWLIAFIAVIIWLIWYIAAYTPGISGYSQYKDLEEDKIKEAAAPSAVPTENPYEKDQKAIAEGKLIYASDCGFCHGEDLKGGVGPDLTGNLKYGETDDKKFLSISGGTDGGMPPFEQQLGRDRIWKVLAYVDSVREYGAKP